MTTCLVTGGAGFIGSHFVDYLLKNTNWEIRVWDYLNYASREAERLREIGAFASARFKFYNRDISQCEVATENFDYIVHLAAETHVDRSIVNARQFVLSNVVGTHNMLEYARSVMKVYPLKKFLYFSTDEVFGPTAPKACFDEWWHYNSSNPYAATKAAGEELALAWANTYKMPVVISHCCNVFGERQHEEKFIPKLVKAIRGGHMISIHANQQGTSGSRMYVYAGDVARAIHLMIEYGEDREKYNIPGREISNEDMAVLVSCALGKEVISQKVYPYADRPGWDFSYRIGGDNLRELGWEPTENFNALLKKTVESMK